MSVAWIRASCVRLTAGLAAVALLAGLGACTSTPKPKPTPTPTPTPTTSAPTTSEPTPSTPDYVVLLEQFSMRMLNSGAPAVLIQTRVSGQEWSMAYGVRSLEGNTPAQVTDPVHVGSITQSMVPVSVLRLVEEGRLRLEDPVSKYLPEFDGVMQYSNSNYVALGLIVQRLRGRPIGEVIRTDVVEPLGLRGTFMTAPGSPPETMIHGYVLVGGERVDVTLPAVQIGSASGGMVSTVPEVNAFYAALLQGKLLKRDTVAEMQSPFNALYGLGLYRWNDTCANGHYFGNAGDLPGYGTIAMSSADGERQLAMTVAYPPRPISSEVSPIVDQMVAVAEETLNVTC